MKKILCYGDSNTFGMIAVTLERYSEDERWSGILKKLLKDDYKIYEEGLSDRNAFVKNSKGYEYCAMEHLSECLKMYPDMDLVVLALGTNDLQFQYDFDEKTVKNGLSHLIDIVRQYNNSAKIIIVPPVILDKCVETGFFGFQFNNISIERSDKTFDLYKQIAEQNNCGYFDFNKIARPSNKDGLHYEPHTHKLIAENFAKYILSVLG